MVIKKSFESYEDALAFIKIHEDEHGLKYVTWKVAKEFLEKIGPTLHNKKLRFPNDEVPYLHLSNGRAYRSCGLGGREGAKHIKKSRSKMSAVTGKRKRPYQNISDEDRDCPACPAGIVIKSLTLFPEYHVLSDWEKRKKTKVTDKLKREFSPQTTVMQNLFIVEIDEHHSSHRKQVQLRLDPRTIECILNVIERGYYSPQDIVDQVKKEIAKMEDITDPHHHRFNPTIDRIRKFAFTHVIKQRNLEREKGYTHDMYEALDRMRELELETNTTFMGDCNFESFGLLDVYEASKTKAIYTSSEQDLRCKVSTEGVPFVVLQTKHFDCSRGVEYQNKFLHPFTARQRKHMSKEGMVMCTARCTFKEIALFPGYRIDESLPQRHVRRQILSRLREDLNNRAAEYERVIAYAFPVVDEHCGHHVREANGHTFLDEEMKSEIPELVTEGVKSLSEMRRHLKMYLKHNFDESTMPGPFNKRYRPSNQTLMNLMYEAGLEPEDIIQDVGEPVEFISKPSHYKDISTRMEEKRRKQEASATLSLIAETENLVETPYNTLIDNLEIFQTIPSVSSKVGFKSELSPQKQPASGGKTGDEFSDTLFKKQSNCQSLLEELLQSVYEMSDMFRLRDLNHHLRKLVQFVKGGRILCDVIPLRKKRPASSTVTSDNAGTNGDDNTFTATPVNRETGLPSTGSAEEPPTKIVIMDQNEQITEVDLPKDYDSSEIVIYQENDETGEQIYLVDKEMFAEEKQAENIIPDPKPEPKKSISAQLDEKRKLYKENAQKDMIKIKCKRYVPKDEIMKKLNIKMNDPQLKKAPLVPSTVNVSLDIKQEIRDQEEEIKRYEDEKVWISKEEVKYITKYNKHETIEWEIHTGDNGSSKGKKRAKGENRDHHYSGSPNRGNYDDNPKDGISSDDELCDGEIVLNLPDGKTKDDKSPEDDSNDAADDRIEALAAKYGGKLTKAPPASASKPQVTPVKKPKVTPPPKAAKTTPSTNLKVGDTITFPPGGFNGLLNNTACPGNVINNPGLAGGLIAINNVVYTNTPYGLVPAFGMPMVVGQNQSLVIGNPAATQTVFGNIPGIQTNTNPSAVSTVCTPSVSQTTSTPSKATNSSVIEKTPATPGNTSQVTVTDDHSYIGNSVSSHTIEDGMTSNKVTNVMDMEVVEDDSVESGESGEVEKHDDSDQPVSGTNQAHTMKLPLVSHTNNGDQETPENTGASDVSQHEGHIDEARELSRSSVIEAQKAPNAEPVIKKTVIVRKEDGKGMDVVKKKTVAMVHIPSVSLTPGMSIKRLDTPSLSKHEPEKYVVLPSNPNPTTPTGNLVAKAVSAGSISKVDGHANKNNAKVIPAGIIHRKTVDQGTQAISEPVSSTSVGSTKEISSVKPANITSQVVKSSISVQTGDDTSVTGYTTVKASVNPKLTNTGTMVTKSGKAVDQPHVEKRITYLDGEIIITVAPKKPQDIVAEVFKDQGKDSDNCSKASSISTGNARSQAAIIKTSPIKQSKITKATTTIGSSSPLVTDAIGTYQVTFLDNTTQSKGNTAGPTTTPSNTITKSPTHKQTSNKASVETNDTELVVKDKPSIKKIVVPKTVQIVTRKQEVTVSPSPVKSKTVIAENKQTPVSKKGLPAKQAQTPSRKEPTVKNVQTPVSKKNVAAKNARTPVIKKDVAATNVQIPANKKRSAVKLDKTVVTPNQSPITMSLSDSVTDSGKMKTRGRQMRFSRSGEKL